MRIGKEFRQKLLSILEKNPGLSEIREIVKVQKQNKLQ